MQVILTVGDAVAAAVLLYSGRDKYLVAKWRWWQDHFGPDRPFASITPDDVDAGITALMQGPALRHVRGQGILPTDRQRTNGTVNRYIAALGSLYKLLKQNRRIPRSFTAPPMRGLRLPEDGGRTLSVTVEDVRRLVEAARLTRNRKLSALIAVAATTGLRKSNLQALRWGDVDLRARTIDVQVTKNRAPVRSILPAWAAKELARIRPTDVDPNREVFGRKDFRKSWFTALDLAGLPETYTFHYCRHMAASILAQSGASLVEIMGVLNHKSPTMALRYSHLNTKTIAEAVSRAWD